MAKKETKPERPVDERRERLLFAVRARYDLQRLRIQAANRATKHANRVKLTDEDQALLKRISDSLLDLEKDTVKAIEKRLKGIPIYERWLKYQRGVGPVLAGVLIGCIDIHRAETASNIWSYAGLAVGADGKAVRRRRGEKTNYDPWLKSKLLKVLGESFVKSNSPWRLYYDNRKHRTSSMRMKCRACDGSGKYKEEEPEITAMPCSHCKGSGSDPVEGSCDACGGSGKLKVEGKPKKGGACKNCDGTGTGPWGRSAEHRALDATRYMVKMFLAALYHQWRTLEGLPIRAPYQEQYLGHVHQDDFAWKTFDGPPGDPIKPKAKPEKKSGRSKRAGVTQEPEQ